MAQGELGPDEELPPILWKCLPVSTEAGVHGDTNSQVAQGMDNFSVFCKISTQRFSIPIQQVPIDHQHPLQIKVQFTYPTPNGAHTN